DLQEVQRFASTLVGGGQRGEEVKGKLAADPGSAASLLQRLAGEQRAAKDGVDRDQQAYNHLLELHFQERGAANHASLSRGVIWQLADDIRRIQRLRSMSADELSAVPEGEADNFVHFFHGLYKRRKHPGGEAVLAQGLQAQSRSAVIFTCSYGDGHKSAQQAVEDFLEAAGFSVEAVDTTHDPRFEDWVQKRLGARLMDVWYNRMVLRWKMYNIQNMIESVGSLIFGRWNTPCPSPSCNNPTKDAFRHVLLEMKPDIVVTVYHMDLLPILEVAKDLGNLPVLHVATDMDLKMREVFSERQPVIYPRFRLAMPFPQTTSQQTALPLGHDRTFLSGYPVRQPFLLPKDEERVRLERAKMVPPGTKVVLVMTGGGGQDVPWPEQLATEGIGRPLHLLVVTGRNEEFKTRLEHALTNSAMFKDGRVVLQGNDLNVTVEVAREPGHRGPNATYLSAERLMMLMDIADAIITKPGGGTTAEISYRGLPAVFDATHGLLHWEEFTVHAFEEQGRGERFVWPQQLPGVLSRALDRPRSIKLVEDPENPGQVLNPGPRIVAEANKLMEVPCRQCKLFPDNPDNI
ncbi:Tmem144, partial [Symbiodinium pilosum]